MHASSTMQSLHAFRPTLGTLYQHGWPRRVMLWSIMSSATRKNACSHSMHQPTVIARNCRSLLAPVGCNARTPVGGIRARGRQTQRRCGSTGGGSTGCGQSSAAHRRARRARGSACRAARCSPSSPASRRPRWRSVGPESERERCERQMCATAAGRAWLSATSSAMISSVSVLYTSMNACTARRRGAVRSAAQGTSPARGCLRPQAGRGGRAATTHLLVLLLLHFGALASRRSRMVLRRRCEGARALRDAHAGFRGVQAAAHRGRACSPYRRLGGQHARAASKPTPRSAG